MLSMGVCVLFVLPGVLYLLLADVCNLFVSFVCVGLVLVVVDLFLL